MLTAGWLDGYYRIVVRRKIFVEITKNGQEGFEMMCSKRSD
jgi:hypothetical protein